MSIYIPKSSKTKTYHYDFWHRGIRFSGSTGKTDKREASKVEAGKREEAKQSVKAVQTVAGLVSFRLDDVAEKYWQEVGQHHAGSHNTARDMTRLIKQVGPDKIITQITDQDVKELVAWRRTHRAAPSPLPKGKMLEDYPLVTNATVNRTCTQLLRKIINHARNEWRVQFPNEIKWGSTNPVAKKRGHLLPEAEEHPRELEGDEGERLEGATRDDYAPFFTFVKASGLRQRECLIRWSQVKRTAGQIRLTGKGGVPVIVPITPDIEAILDFCQGHHPEWVFTYVAARTVKPRKIGETYIRTGKRAGRGEPYEAQREAEARVEGRRYPMTLSGIKTAWKRLRKKAGVKGFRFHDFRHDLGTKVLRDTGDLRLVGTLLNHRSLKTTARYAHVMGKDAAAALAAYQAKHVRLPKAVQDRDGKSHEKSHEPEKDIA